MRKYLTEFIGTFFLVFTVAMAAVAGHAGDFAGLAIGGVLMVMIFAGGHISGGHYNPAVSMAVYRRGGLAGREMINYWVAQLLGGAVAAALASQLFGVAAAAPMQLQRAQALTAEFLFTFALAYVVVLVATAKATQGNSFYGLAIGFTVVAGAYAVGKVSGGAFNPAVAGGIGILGVLGWADVVGYWVVQLVAGAVAGHLFRYLHPRE
ncbi:MAG: aquaporin [Thermoanaerobaculia bacterium]|nr:aquaporin [Thermoanaerobaculia bacterium]